ncbi:unnamed protein product [Tenebrio molitor]|nr:unnamed protein product [Tenebrio molitor]
MDFRRVRRNSLKYKIQSSKPNRIVDVDRKNNSAKRHERRRSKKILFVFFLFLICRMEWKVLSFPPSLGRETQRLIGSFLFQQLSTSRRLAINFSKAVISS